jgi:hypothetical protein
MHDKKEKLIQKIKIGFGIIDREYDEHLVNIGYCGPDKCILTLDNISETAFQCVIVKYIKLAIITHQRLNLLVSKFSNGTTGIYMCILKRIHIVET